LKLNKENFKNQLSYFWMDFTVDADGLAIYTPLPSFDVEVSGSQSFISIFIYDDYKSFNKI